MYESRVVVYDVICLSVSASAKLQMDPHDTTTPKTNDLEEFCGKEYKVSESDETRQYFKFQVRHKPSMVLRGN